MQVMSRIPARVATPTTRVPVATAVYFPRIGVQGREQEGAQGVGLTRDVPPADSRMRIGVTNDGSS